MLKHMVREKVFGNAEAEKMQVIKRAINHGLYPLPLVEESKELHEIHQAFAWERLADNDAP